MIAVIVRLRSSHVLGYILSAYLIRGWDEHVHR